MLFYCKKELKWCLKIYFISVEENDIKNSVLSEAEKAAGVLCIWKKKQHECIHISSLQFVLDYLPWTKMLNISIPPPKTSIIYITLLNKAERNVEFEITFIKLLGLLSNMETKVARIMYMLDEFL